MLIKNTGLKEQIKEVDEQKGVVQMYVNAFGNVDSDNDISEPGSFSKTIKENGKRVKHFLNHSWDKLIGVPIEMKEDDTGLLVTSKLNLQSPLAKEVFEFYKMYAEQGMTLEHSVGLDAIKYEENQDTGIRNVKEWKLWEYSTLYAWGANENTPMVDIKNMNFEDAFVTLDYMLKKGNFREETFKEIEKKYNELKALIKEPPQSTLNEDEPLTLDYMLNSVKILENGKRSI